MKKMIAILLAALCLLSLTACAAKGEPAGTDESAQPQIADALTLLNTVWDSYADDEKFPASGGDYNEENMTTDAPGKVGLEDAESIEYLLSVPADVLAQFDDAASLIHMMNTNTFTCGAFRMTDETQAETIAASMKDYLLNKQWMCGFPEQMVIVSVGGYLVECFGAADLVSTFQEKLLATYPTATVLTDEAITLSRGTGLTHGWALAI